MAKKVADFYIGQNSEFSRFIQQQLFKLGYLWGTCGSMVTNTDKPHLQIWDDGEITYSFDKTDCKNYLDLTILNTPFKKPIHINDNVVEFMPGKIKVGCTTISNEIVEEIVKRLKK